MPLERRLHDPALHAGAPSVNEADLAEPGLVRGVHVLVDERRHVAWLERVQVEAGVDRESKRGGPLDAG